MSDLFKKIIKERYEPQGFKVSKLIGTRHWNVLRIYDPFTDKYYIAKGIMHIEGDDELSENKMDISFENEIQILKKLPNWWGLYLKDSFKQNPFRIIVTPELTNCKWSGFKGNTTQIANKLYKQIEWLHNNKITHNDLELKNILLTCDNKNAIIIDFEKSLINSSNSSMKDDYRKLLENLNENEETKGIAKKLNNLVVRKFRKTHRYRPNSKKTRRLHTKL